MLFLKEGETRRDCLHHGGAGHDEPTLPSSQPFPCHTAQLCCAHATDFHVHCGPKASRELRNSHVNLTGEQEFSFWLWRVHGKEGHQNPALGLDLNPKPLQWQGAEHAWWAETSFRAPKPDTSRILNAQHRQQPGSGFFHLKELPIQFGIPRPSQCQILMLQPVFASARCSNLPKPANLQKFNILVSPTE